jgi:hypothetical protein
MSRTGTCYDNAAAESFFATLKLEAMPDGLFASRQQARMALFDYIEVFYNRQRLHSDIHYARPVSRAASVVVTPKNWGRPVERERFVIMSGIRRPIVGSESWRYILIMVVSFAASVVATRVYLEATGYPQIGNATFHFAHALWGGILQTVATLLLLTCVNRWVSPLSAVLSGVGIGLFVDEVGKFITQNNDYFFPLAAPIIYVFFLLLLLVYLVIHRRTRRDPRSEMYAIVRQLADVLENDLTASEHGAMLLRLETVSKQTNRPEVAELAGHLSDFLQSQAIPIAPDRESWVEPLLRRLANLEKSLLTPKRARSILVFMFLTNGLFAVIMLVVLASLLTQTGLWNSELLQILLSPGNIDNATSLSWYLVMIMLHLLAGLLVFGGALAFLMRRDELAIGLGVASLVITVTFINTLSFYFSQFSVLLSSIYSFAALLALQRYRDRFLRHAEPESR